MGIHFAYGWGAEKEVQRSADLFVTEQELNEKDLL
jgi:hypothetical protein